MDEETKEDSLMKQPGIDGKSQREIQLVQVVICDTAPPSTGCKHRSKTKEGPRSLSSFSRKHHHMKIDVSRLKSCCATQPLK